MQLLGKARARTQRLQPPGRQPLRDRARRLAGLQHLLMRRHLLPRTTVPHEERHGRFHIRLTGSFLHALFHGIRRHDILNLVHSPCPLAAQKAHVAVT